MLSAAKDILDKNDAQNAHSDEQCIHNMSQASYSPISTGTVLLADIIPALIIKLCVPICLYRFAYNLRVGVTVILMAGSFVIVALSETVFWGLVGVVFASLGSGLGEVTFLSMSSHFSGDVISAWSSGTGGAGVIGSLAYAMLTEKMLMGLSPRNTLLVMLIIPSVFATAYRHLLDSPPSIISATWWKPQTYFLSNASVRGDSSDSVSEDQSRPLMQYDGEGDQDNLDVTTVTPPESRYKSVKPLLKYMIPLGLVYFGEYFINQGLVELLIFDCVHGFFLRVSSQYRWYQVLYQLGVFLSRSSVVFFRVGRPMLIVLAVTQLMNAVGVFLESVLRFVPHIFLIFLWMFFEGFLGGAAYVNTFRLVHKEVPLNEKEFSMSFVSTSDSIGILLAGFASIPVHNYICARLLPSARGGMSARPALLSPQETFEQYERRTPSRLSPTPIPATFTPNGTESVTFVNDGSRMFEKKDIPYTWIICIAVSALIFIVVVLFVATWLQELGFL